MTSDEFNSFFAKSRFTSSTDSALERTAGLLWREFRRNGRWLQPEATQVAEEMLKRGWLDMSPLRVAIVDFGYQTPVRHQGGASHGEIE